MLNRITLGLPALLRDTMALQVSGKIRGQAMSENGVKESKQHYLARYFVKAKLT